MNLEAVNRYKELIDSLNDSSLFMLKERSLFYSRYKLRKTIFFAYIYLKEEKYLFIEWKAYCPDASIDRILTGEQVFNALPDIDKDEAVFHIDIFSFANKIFDDNY